ncbi:MULTISPECIES: response regulator transcription factor [Micromonospora]|uniref:Response regulatory domain-containing protein n=1 Tax=Micromonospora sicca TaxID=2202420 RepID=A0A317DRI7_9ACTN|nr:MULTISPECIES: response regulator [unclassified Micromonospora]MBM0224640.1 response regulator [Micromonospora sp. ATA51]PWR15445.1 hypothetical protein DKT69_10745 [Micromonospora sp. 4G51]
MRLLLVEDDIRVAGALATALQRRGYLVEHAGTVAAAVAAGPADLVLLDLNLPDGDGLAVCRSLRAASAAVGIIVLTARGESSTSEASLPDLIRALGADHPDVLDSRWDLARYHRQNGNRSQAARQFQEVLADRDRIHGAEDQQLNLARQELEDFLAQPG